MNLGVMINHFLIESVILPFWVKLQFLRSGSFFNLTMMMTGSSKNHLV